MLLLIIKCNYCSQPVNVLLVFGLCFSKCCRLSSDTWWHFCTFLVR